MRTKIASLLSQRVNKILMTLLIARATRTKYGSMRTQMVLASSSLALERLELGYIVAWRHP